MGLFLFDPENNHQWRKQQQHQPVIVSGVGSVVALETEAVDVVGVEVVAVGEAEDVEPRTEIRTGFQSPNLAVLSRMGRSSLWRRSICSPCPSKNVTSSIPFWELEC